MKKRLSNGKDPSFADNNSETESSNMLTTPKPTSEISPKTDGERGKELDRTLGFWHAFVFMVAIFFGSGIFITPGLIAKETSDMGMAIVIWITAGIPCLLGALCFCELSCMYGKTGGEYIYIYEAYGDVIGFVCIWTQMVVMAPVGLAIASQAISHYVITPFYDIKSSVGLWLSKSVAITMVGIATLINCKSTSFVGKSQIWFTVIQILSVFFIIILGIWRVSTGHVANYATMFTNTTNFDVASFGMAFYNGLWGYDGWDLTVNVSEELKDLETNLWLSTVTSIPFVILCFVSINLAFMSALTRNEIAASSTVVTTFVRKLFGNKVALVIPILVVFCCFGYINGISFMMARMGLSAAREGQLPYCLSLIHKKLRTPIPASLLFFVLTLVWMLIPHLDIEGLIAICNLCLWVHHLLSIFSVIVMRIRKPDMKRPVKVWIINPIFTSLFSLLLVIIPFFKRPVESAVCTALFISAFPLYYIFIKKHDSLPSCLLGAMDSFNDFLMNRCNLVPCVFDDDDDYSIGEEEEENSRESLLPPENKTQTEMKKFRFL